MPSFVAKSVTTGQLILFNFDNVSSICDIKPGRANTKRKILVSTNDGIQPEEFLGTVEEIWKQMFPDRELPDL